MCVYNFFLIFKKGCIIEWIKKKNFNQINKLINLFLNRERKNKKKTNKRTNLLVSVSSHQKLLHSIKK